MSTAKRFIEDIVGSEEDNGTSALNRIKTKVLSENIMPDSSIFKCRKKRMKMYKNNPDAFLSVSDNGTPVFPIRNQFGGMSYTILKRGISAAKSAHKRTGDPKYLEIIRKLEEDKRAMENKISKVPETYHPMPELTHALIRYKK